MTKLVTIVDYGMGNLWSVRSAVEYLGAAAETSSDPARVAQAGTLILPGVGSFRKAMDALRERGLDEAIRESTLRRGGKILGICLGMQLFAARGSEDGASEGLGLIPTSVERFTAHETASLKIPHVGFNHVFAPADSALFRGVGSPSDFYFVHSYRMRHEGLAGKLAMCRYGVDFLAAFEHDNVFATQFHPEKSQTNGLTLLANFLDA